MTVDGQRHASPAAGIIGSSSVEQPDYWWYVVRSRLLEEVFLHAVPPGGRVLDVGSADGPSVQWMADRAKRICVDLDPRGLAPGGVCADALHLPFGTAAFDAVAAFDVVEHFPDEEGILGELIRVLRPGGALLLAVPAYQWAWTTFDVAAGHHRRYTRPRLRRALATQPVHIDRVTHAFAGVFPFFAVDRLRSRLRPPSPSTELPEVPGPVDLLLRAISRLDLRLLRRTDLPLGSSIMLLATKDA